MKDRKVPLAQFRLFVAAVVASLAMQSCAALTSPRPSPSRQPDNPAGRTTVASLASPTPVILATPATAHYALYQTMCFTPDACVYDSLALNPKGFYLPLFHLSSDESSSVGFAKYILSFSFAHFAERLADWANDARGELWIADIHYQHPQVVYVDETGRYAHIPDGEGIDLIWSPDDLHLIVEVSDHSAPDLIYHVRTGLVESWPWECDRVAVSPRSKELATWCASSTGDSRYAVVEWGGEIWYSDNAPSSEIVRAIRLSPGRYHAWLRPWAWSADGEQIAYFDPADQNGYLHIANASGERLRVLPGGVVGLGKTMFLSSEDLQWSQDGRRLRVSAHGNADHPCLHDPQVTGDITCWQVLDTETGAVLWTLADSAKTISNIAEWAPIHTAISPDGKLVALTLIKPSVNEGFVVNIETEEIKGIGAPVVAMRWGLQP